MLWTTLRSLVEYDCSRGSLERTLIMYAHLFSLDAYVWRVFRSIFLDSERPIDYEKLFFYTISLMQGK